MTFANKSDTEKADMVSGLRQRVANTYSAIPSRYVMHESAGLGKKTNTIASFDIGLRPTNGALEFSGTEEETLSCLYRIIQPAYAANALSV